MTAPHLLPALDLERTSVVANNTMNRERGLTGVNSYARELGLDPVAHLTARSATPSWLDLCSGEGRALREAGSRLPAAVLTGVDLVGPLGRAPTPAGLELLTASVAHWSPSRTYDLITCYSARHHRLALRGPRTVRLPFRYLGADPAAGPNYTGQPAVASYYEPVPVAAVVAPQ
ncbi:class I SAM-dependent methyltransferase [Streptomyces sp. NPDC001586]|uniref:class I SAM-dependent methyltransferase n=1 Tax=Streptomyces sp. NPDC001586 TaxID=3154387 RepID=UPI003329DB96